MSAEDNLSPKQFTEEHKPGFTEESEEYHNASNTKLKSPWVPAPDAGKDVWNKHWQRSDMEYHLENHHEKYASKDPEGKVWGPIYKNVSNMTPSQFHDHLHEIGYFRFNKEHKHFVPKNKK